MSENENTTESNAAESTEKPKGSLLPWVMVGVAAAGVGAAVPFGMTMMAGAPAPSTTENPATTNPTNSMVFMEFGEVTVNLNEGRMNRYLALKIALHVRKSDEAMITKAINEKKLILQNWLLSHLSDKELNDIRGKAGQNMLRREIRDHLNSVLFPDNYERVYDVLFESFNVQ